MARARMLATDASIDPELNSLTLPALTLYLLTIPHLDRDGLIDANPVRLAAQAAPLRPELRDGAGAMINEWVEAGLVVRYPSSRNQNVLYFKGFRKHNRFEYRKDSPSVYPPPPGWFRNENGLIPEDQDACFQLAARMHPENKYRKALLDYAKSDDASRSGLEDSRSGLDDFSPRTEQIRSGENGGDAFTHTPTHHVGNSERGYAKLAATLAEMPDNDLRIGLDAIAAKYLLEESFTGWTRTVASLSREDLLFVLATLKTWDYQPDEQIKRMYNPPGVLKAAMKATPRSWPILANDALVDLAADIDDAVELASLPTLEAREAFADRRFQRQLAITYSPETFFGGKR